MITESTERKQNTRENKGKEKKNMKLPCPLHVKSHSGDMHQQDTEVLHKL